MKRQGDGICYHTSHAVALKCVMPLALRKKWELKSFGCIFFLPPFTTILARVQLDMEGYERTKRKQMQCSIN